MLADFSTNNFSNGQASETRVYALDDRPGCRTGTGTHDGPFRCCLEAIINVPVLPILRGDTPAGKGIFFKFLQSLLLCITTQVHPEFEDQRPVIGKRLLESQNTIQMVIEYRLIILVMDPA